MRRKSFAWITLGKLNQSTVPPAALQLDPVSPKGLSGEPTSVVTSVVLAYNPDTDVLASYGGAMADFDFIHWKPHIVRHVAQNGLSTDEVEDVLYDPASRRTNSKSRPFRPARIGTTSTGKQIIVVFDEFEDGGFVIIEPVTA
jgi:hypothetical protein